MTVEHPQEHPGIKPNPEAVIDKIADAIERNDMDAMRAIYADDVRIWHSFDGVTQNKDQGIALLSLIATLGKPRYRVLERICVGNRVVQRHELTITSWDGSRRYLLPAALFLTIRDGQVAVLDEYADSRQVGEIVAAIEHARDAGPRG